MCKYAYETEYEFDLSKPDSVTLTHVRFGQTLDVAGPQPNRSN
jgi:hypothetical protein